MRHHDKLALQYALDTLKLFGGCYDCGGPWEEEGEMARCSNPDCAKLFDRGLATRVKNAERVLSEMLERPAPRVTLPSWQDISKKSRELRLASFELPMLEQIVFYLEPPNPEAAAEWRAKLETFLNAIASGEGL